MSAMRISRLAERTGVPATTLRYYGAAGLLPAARTASGYRVYGEDAVERLEFIGAAKHLGLPLEEIAELLSVWESGACREVKAELRPRIAARLAAAEGRAAELAAFTAGLRAALEHLAALPDRTGRCDPGCGFLAPGRATAVPERWRAAAVACSLGGGAREERVAAWRRALDGARRVEIPEGLRLTLPAARAATVAGLAADEQGCCPFLDFRLHLDGPDLHLEVRAPAEGAALLTELFTPAA
ncbi:MerR family transcriptional regulator [Streptomyces avicenniae]|uniref:MerR family transcriptional regulator n=1 Tax=Streptomyces avicenniae TaxID=500153 RepID=UPI00069A9A8C|nr:MerR family transcriptional regulator [Streptomyces avicenniae]